MIERVDLIEHALPLERPFRIARGTTHTLTTLTLRLETPQAIGYGPATPSPSVTGETLDDARRHLEQITPDQLDPDDIPATLDRIEAGPSAKAAIDLALLDLQGKHAQTPSHRLLDLPDGEKPSAGTVTVTTVDDAIKQARTWTQRGHAHLKLKIDRDTPVLDLVDALHETLPETFRDPFPDPAMWIDANESLTLKQATQLAHELADRDILYLEQPLPKQAHNDLATLAQDSPLPIVIDEGIQTPQDVERLTRLEGDLGINVKVQKVGGLHVAKTCLEKAQEANMATMVGCNIETGLGIAAGACLTGAMHHVDLDGNLFLQDDPFPLPRPKPGHIATPTQPGLGAYPHPRHANAKAHRRNT